MDHDLKVWPEFFEPLAAGLKTFEVRKNDRGYRMGDYLTLREYLPHRNHYTGRSLTVLVTYILEGENAVSYGVAPGFVVMGFRTIGGSVTDNHQPQILTAVNAGGQGAFSAEASARPSASAFLYEAENGVRTNGSIIYNDSFASAAQGIGGMNGSAAPGITLNGVNGGSGGVKTLLIRYGCSTVSTKNLYVNGVKITKVTFPATGAFSGSPAAYNTVSLPITLVAGTANTIAVINDNYDPYGVNLDYFSVD